MTHKPKPSLAFELAAVILSASLLLAAGAKAAPPSLENLIPSAKQVCRANTAALKLMSFPRMISPAQFCPIPEGERTSRSLKSCWESYLRNPDAYKKQQEACAAPPAEDDLAVQETAVNIPPEMFRFLSDAR